MKILKSAIYHKYYILPTQVLFEMERDVKTK